MNSDKPSRPSYSLESKSLRNNNGIGQVVTFSCRTGYEFQGEVYLCHPSQCLKARMECFFLEWSSSFVYKNIHLIIKMMIKIIQFVQKWKEIFKRLHQNFMTAWHTDSLTDRATTGDAIAFYYVMLPTRPSEPVVINEIKDLGRILISVLFL